MCAPSWEANVSRKSYTYGSWNIYVHAMITLLKKLTNPDVLDFFGLLVCTLIMYGEGSMDIRVHSNRLMISITPVFTAIIIKCKLLLLLLRKCIHMYMYGYVCSDKVITNKSQISQHIFETECQFENARL